MSAVSAHTAPKGRARRGAPSRRPGRSLLSAAPSPPRTGAEPAPAVPAPGRHPEGRATAGRRPSHRACRRARSGTAGRRWPSYRVRRHGPRQRPRQRQCRLADRPRRFPTPRHRPSDATRPERSREPRSCGASDGRSMAARRPPPGAAEAAPPRRRPTSAADAPAADAAPASAVWATAPSAGTSPRAPGAGGDPRAVAGLVSEPLRVLVALGSGRSVPPDRRAAPAGRNGALAAPGGGAISATA